METFLRASAVRRWIKDNQDVAHIKVVSDLLSKSFPLGRGTHHENELIENVSIDLDEEVTLQDGNEEAINALLSRLHSSTAKHRESQMKLLKRCRINGIIYASSNTHEGNSLIEFRQSETSRNSLVGEIEYIIQDFGHLHLTVRPQQPLPAGTIDPFSEYNDFPGKLYSSKLGESLLIGANQVISHVARFCDPETKETVIVSLGRF